MSQDSLDYRILLQDALRDLVRRSLAIVAGEGLPGDHHFYLSFKTRAPGVEMPAHLIEQHPEEMTIVLKTRFRDLSVGDEAFSVGLFFGGVLHYLTIPFAALSTFTDPSAGFQVSFQDAAPEAEEAAPGAEEAEAAPRAEEAEAAAGPAPSGGSPPGGKVVSFPSGRRSRK